MNNKPPQYAYCYVRLRAARTKDKVITRKVFYTDQTLVRDFLAKCGELGDVRSIDFAANKPFDAAELEAARIEGRFVP